ncbi:hypothetical protein [Pseudovibrio sp. Tun.PSC04-5.I4]|uniref:hypothetical protein n=1 Tax=Pseudovibrio sp. Tun.PSC04-5.I4 TaxID=1798213 RepID=UPI00088EFFCE|nr:hypothetical protein [Pseudovibrio sp. Tun.PSC04-5.I4]SDR07619.1 hypothetical protein SAMN04515695_2628 [Pseudovibrio sp. Tun.PSC04-5.I4]
MSTWTKATTYSDIQKAILTQIKVCELLEPHALIAASPGIVSERWLQDQTIPRSGAAFVGIGRLASVKNQADGTSEHELGLGVFVASPQGHRDTQAQTSVDTVHGLTQIIKDNRFELVKAQKPVGISARNLYSPSLDRLGSALWLIEWRQSFILFDAEGTALGNAASRSLGREERVDA